MTAAELADLFRSLHRHSAATETQRQHFLGLEPAKEAAVLLAALPHPNGWHLLLTLRANTLRGHRGEISLPGGRREPHDTDPAATALRETAEETGICAAHWHTFPALPPLDTPSGYRVRPVPALCTESPTFKPNPDEVAEIILLPLDYALNLQHYRLRPLHYRGRSLDMPTLPYLHHDIWGLTAMILYGLAERCAAYRAQTLSSNA